MSRNRSKPTDHHILDDATHQRITDTLQRIRTLRSVADDLERMISSMVEQATGIDLAHEAWVLDEARGLLRRQVEPEKEPANVPDPQH